MARGEHHRTHAQDRAQRSRLRIAQEAARLMSEHGIRDFHHAKRKAAQRLGILESQALPRNLEIEQALRERQRLFRADSQPKQLHRLRTAAVEAMQFLQSFQPRLVGRVLDGSADTHSAVCLHVFADHPEVLELFLQEHGVPVYWQARGLRLQRFDLSEYPVALFATESAAFDLTVFPVEALRQAPLNPVDEKPMPRAALTAVQLLLEEPPPVY